MLARVASKPGLSIRALARHLGRDYKRVHGDVTALERIGLIERDAAGACRHHRRRSHGADRAQRERPSDRPEPPAPPIAAPARLPGRALLLHLAALPRRTIAGSHPSDHRPSALSQALPSAPAWRRSGCGPAVGPAAVRLSVRLAGIGVCG